MHRTSLFLGCLAAVSVAGCGGSTAAPAAPEVAQEIAYGDDELSPEEAGDDVAETGEEPGEDPGGDPADPGVTDPGTIDPGADDPGAVDPGTPDPGYSDPGKADPGTVDPGKTDPGKTDPGQPGTGAVTFLDNTQYLTDFLDVVNNAKSTLKICTLDWLQGSASYTPPEKAQAAVLAAVGRGVKVQVLLDSQTDYNATRVQALTAAGAQARLTTSSKTLHVKLVVADAKRVLVGSSNLSTSSMNYNNEDDLLFDDAAVGAAFAQYCDTLWADDGAVAKLPTAPVDGFQLLGDTQYEPAVQPLLKAAKQRALLIMYEFNWDTSSSAQGLLATALKTAKANGADVRVVLEAGSTDATLTSFNNAAAQSLAAAGISTRWDPTTLTTHAKLLVLDDAVVVYSGNWVTSSMKTNHEAGAIVDDAAAVAAAAKYFEQVWNTGTTAP